MIYLNLESGDFMKAKEIFQYLLENSLEIWEQTCDGLIAGDPEKEVKKLQLALNLLQN